MANAARSVSAKPATPRKPQTPAAQPKPTGKPRMSRKATAAAIDPEVRRGYIEVAAYYIAERRGFTGGTELEDWIQAEEEVDRMLGG